MVSIHRLPVTLPQSSPRSKPVSSSQTPSQPTEVARAVAQTVRDPSLIEEARGHIQYDQPQGKGHEAVSSYLGVMNQQRRDELSAMVGVDVYV
ncbi:hypothetical protein ABT56_02875 [Photobacterium aquae]|uniref:Chromosome partitioning protein ParA n=1 Tax=Photobacterium aquae TaxID=1195763 RepID=A0A0J1HBW1_9GAMM|nr:hypothetical protein [Photobacterium aquae]KLV09153.1 hypothetical protein ABT56_02875 [Photobacterium aquae]